MRKREHLRGLAVRTIDEHQGSDPPLAVELRSLAAAGAIEQYLDDRGCFRYRPATIPATTPATTPAATSHHQEEVNHHGSALASRSTSRHRPALLRDVAVRRAGAPPPLQL